jgi:hypothetical protein
MTAATADRLPVYVAQRGTPLDIDMPMAASTTVYLNCLVNSDSAGRVKNATDAASEFCAGIATVNKTCSAVAGSSRTNARTGVVIEFFIEGATIDATDVGKNASVKDNQTVCDATEAANDVRVGVIVAVENGKAYVDVGRFAPTAA